MLQILMNINEMLDTALGARFYKSEKTESCPQEPPSPVGETACTPVSSM